MNKIKRTALVVGAGPGGSTAAYYLAKLGVDVLFVDKETWPRDKICGGVYVPALYPILKEMGAYDEMIKYQACSITEFRLVDRQEDYIDMKTEAAMIAPRRFTDDWIRRAAIRMGADFMENYEATSLIMRKGVVKGVHGLYHNTEMDIEADITIIANGSHSELSRQLGLLPDPSDLTCYAFRTYVDGVEGLPPHMAEEYYVPEGLDGWSPICTTWLNPHYGGKKAVLGLTINEDALRDSGLSAMDFYRFWRDNTKFGQMRLKNATLIDKFRGWRLPGCRQLNKSVVPGAIGIGDAVEASECAFDYGIPSAMTGGMIAANVIAGCAAKDDFSYDAIKVYQQLAEEQLNPSLSFNAVFRDELLNKEDVMKDFFQYVKAQPGYPDVMFGEMAAKFMMEVLKLDLGGNKSNQ